MRYAQEEEIEEIRKREESFAWGYGQVVHACHVIDDPAGDLSLLRLRLEKLANYDQDAFSVARLVNKIASAKARLGALDGSDQDRQLRYQSLLTVLCNHENLSHDMQLQVFVCLGQPLFVLEDKAMTRTIANMTFQMAIDLPLRDITVLASRFASLLPSRKMLKTVLEATCRDYVRYACGHILLDLALSVLHEPDTHAAAQAAIRALLSTTPVPNLAEMASNATSTVTDVAVLDRLAHACIEAEVDRETNTGQWPASLAVRLVPEVVRRYLAGGDTRSAAQIAIRACEAFAYDHTRGRNTEFTVSDPAFGALFLFAEWEGLAELGELMEPLIAERQEHYRTCLFNLAYVDPPNPHYASKLAMLAGDMYSGQQYDLNEDQYLRMMTALTVQYRRATASGATTDAEALLACVDRAVLRIPEPADPSRTFGALLRVTDRDLPLLALVVRTVSVSFFPTAAAECEALVDAFTRVVEWQCDCFDVSVDCQIHWRALVTLLNDLADSADTRRRISRLLRCRIIPFVCHDIHSSVQAMSGLTRVLAEREDGENLCLWIRYFALSAPWSVHVLVQFVDTVYDLDARGAADFAVLSDACHDMLFVPSPTNALQPLIYKITERLLDWVVPRR